MAVGRTQSQVDNPAGGQLLAYSRLIDRAGSFASSLTPAYLELFGVQTILPRVERSEDVRLGVAPFRWVSARLSARDKEAYVEATGRGGRHSRSNA